MKLRVRESSLPAETLMRDVLRAGDPIASEYPLLFDEGSTGCFVTAEPDEEPTAVRSACAFLMRNLVVPVGSIPVGMVGSVATAPEARGGGLASDVLDRACAEVAARGGLMCMLWADDPRFYEERDWYPMGGETDHLLEGSLDWILPAPEGVRPARSDDYEAMHTLYEQHPERVGRSAEESAQLYAMSGVELFVREDAGRVVAYSAMGRGEDLTGCVHEWAGAPADVLAVLAQHLAGRKERGEDHELIVMAPVTEGGLRGFFEMVKAPSAQGILGLAKIVRFDLAAQLLDALSGTEGSAREEGQGRVLLTGPLGEVLLDGATLIEVVFTARGSDHVVRHIEEATGLSLPALPIRPFAWGLDSI